MNETAPASSSGFYGGSSFFRKKRPFRGPQATQIPESEDPTAASKDETPRPATALKKSHSRRESSISSLTDLRSNIRRRSASLRSRGGHSPTRDSLGLNQSPDKRSASTASLRPSLTVSTSHSQRQRSHDSVEDGGPLRPSTSATESRSARLPFPHGLKKDDTLSVRTGLFSDADGRSTTTATPVSATVGSQNAVAVYGHVQEQAAKRISTLEYLRRAHEGRVYWFNTLHFKQSDLSSIPYFDQKKLARRAANFLMLGLSVPAQLDPSSDSALDYLRAFNAVLGEFEAYSAIHNPDGPSSNPGRTRIPNIFKRPTHSAGTKGRRGSSADAISPLNSNDGYDLRSASSNSQPSSAASAALPSFPAGDQELLPGEEYSHFLTPSLPFDPDYFETFATLCDVLIDCYNRIMGLVNSPAACEPGVGDLFAKVDARIRKLVMTNVIRDFGEASNNGIKSEIAGLGKLALGGLM